MNNLQINIENYLEYCRTQKRLDSKTIKAYCIDFVKDTMTFPFQISILYLFVV